jgi:putative hemolysin
MKNIISVLALLFIAAPVFAAPAVGDQAFYNVTNVEYGKTWSGTNEMKIMSINPAGTEFEIQSTEYFHEKTEVYNYRYTEQDFWPYLMADATLANCVSYGGKLETTTVPAGTFNTCALPDQGGTVWIAAGVPFGYVKVDVPGTSLHTHFELVSFIKGK